MTTKTNVTFIAGSQYGDEGKGRVIDLLVQTLVSKILYAINLFVVRCSGGPNAGHQIWINGEQFVTHSLPSGVLTDGVTNVIGNGCFIHLGSLVDEIKGFEARGLKIRENLKISDKAHIVLDMHKDIDRMKEQELDKDNASIGTTKQGIGPCASSKVSRNGIRIMDLCNETELRQRITRLATSKCQRFAKFNYTFDIEACLNKLKEQYKFLKPCICETVQLVNDAIDSGKTVLVEGAQALFLDINFGVYPYVTSCDASVGGVCTGTGIPPMKITQVIGVMKAYLTRVGHGYFPTELSYEHGVGLHLATEGNEYGSTTGRPRKVGWLDLVMMKYSNRVNGYTHMALMKTDVLSGLDEIKVCVGYMHKGKSMEWPSDLNVLKDYEPVYLSFDGWTENISNCRTFAELPLNAQTYIKYIKDYLKIPIISVGVGPNRDQVIENPKELLINNNKEELLKMLEDNVVQRVDTLEQNVDNKKFDDVKETLSNVMANKEITDEQRKIIDDFTDSLRKYYTNNETVKKQLDFVMFNQKNTSHSFSKF